MTTTPTPEPVNLDHIDQALAKATNKTQFRWEMREIVGGTLFVLFMAIFGSLAWPDEMHLSSMLSQLDAAQSETRADRDAAQVTHAAFNYNTVLGAHIATKTCEIPDKWFWPFAGTKHAPMQLAINNAGLPNEQFVITCAGKQIIKKLQDDPHTR